MSIAFVGFGAGHFHKGVPFDEMVACATEATALIANTPLPVEVGKEVMLEELPAALEESAKMSTKAAKNTATKRR